MDQPRKERTAEQLAQFTRTAYQAIEALQENDGLLRFLERNRATEAEVFIDEHQDLIKACGFDLDFYDTAETIGLFTTAYREGACNGSDELFY